MKTFFAALAAVGVLALANPTAAAQPAEYAELAAFIAKAKHDAGDQSGTAVALVKDGQLVYQAYVGYADIAGKRPVTADTAFYIASATKPFFALNALLQAERGRIDLRTPLSDMFPEARFAGFDASSIHLKELLTHGSGIENGPLVWATAYSGIHDAGSRRALVAQSVPDTDGGPGRFRYGNVGYNIASVWLDRQLAEPWQDQLARTLFAPLGMRRTTAYASRAEARAWPMALPYSHAGAEPGLPLYLRKTDDTMQAAGGLISTAPDLAAFLIAQTSDGRVHGRQALPRAVLAQSQQPQIALDSRYLDFARTGYAWGWYTGEYKQRAMLHHFGGFAGFHAHLSFMPAERAGLVVLNNEDTLGPRLTALIADYAYGLLMGESGLADRLDARRVQFVGQAAELRAAVAKQRAQLAQREWRLSRPMADYAGTYRHPLLGDMQVRLEAGDSLAIRWGRVQSRAGAFDAPDAVRVEFSPNAGERLDFLAEPQGVVALRFAGATFSRIP